MTRNYTLTIKLMNCLIYKNYPGMRGEQERGVHEELRINSGKGRLLIVRDLNLPGIDWVQKQEKSRAVEDFLNVIQNCLFIQFVQGTFGGK